MEKITIDRFKINMKPVTFNNPHGWTEEQILELLADLKKNFHAAFNIQCMAIADIIQRSPPND